jgi:hypothetical protein
MYREITQERKTYSNGRVISKEVITVREIHACLPSMVENVSVEWKRYSGKRKKHKGLVFSMKFV